MKYLLKDAFILDAASAFHRQRLDVLVENGTITAIGNDLSADGATCITADNLHVSVGWLDLGTVATDPGLEHKETLETLAAVAAAGGFTDVAVLPNTVPVVQTKSGITYFKRFSGGSAVTIHPMAAVTKDTAGTDFTEMMDLHHAGAVAFTDGLTPLWNADILLKTLLYLSPMNALLINRPEEKTLAFMGQMNEGIMSTQLGMKGIPDVAEELIIMRDLELLQYADIRSDLPVLHFSKVSTVGGIKRIKDAKQRGLPVSCDVSVNQLVFTDEDLRTFDTEFKVSPPYRDKKTQKALRKALQEGIIDTVISDHHPHEEEVKKLPFDEADAGILGLQTFLANALAHSSLSPEQLIEKITRTNRLLLRMNCPTIAVGAKTPLTLFDPEAVWQYNEGNNVSTAKNSPFFGKELTGRVIGIYNKGQMVLAN